MAVRIVLLAPGASGNAETLAPYISGLRRHGLSGQAVELPSRSAEPALAAYRAALEGHPADASIIGGQSFGGRVASLLAAETPVAGLVLMSYPLHAPGKHAAWDERTAHWPRIRCPVLLLSGEADPFARLDLLRSAVDRLAEPQLVTYPRIGHGLGRVLDDAVTHIAEFASGLRHR